MATHTQLATILCVLGSSVVKAGLAMPVPIDSPDTQAIGSYNISN